MNILVIPDSHVKADVDLSHLDWLGQFIVDQKPEVIVHIGDFADMESLSSYDKGRKSAEGRRYVKDKEAAWEGMRRLLAPLEAHNENQRQNRKKRYQPQMHMLLGNHEHRITRAIEDGALFEGTISIEDLGYESSGWAVHDFLKVIEIEGIAFSHYFTSGVMGRPVASARALLQKKHQSAVMGHVQHRDIAFDYRPNGDTITGLFVGTYYQHEEKYLGNQGNNHYRGIWMLKNVVKGQFEAVPYNLEEIREIYSQV